VVITPAVQASLQSQLDTLLLADPPASQAAVDELRGWLYAAEHAIDLGGSGDRGTNTDIAITFLPESRGWLLVEVAIGPATSIENVDITRTNAPGVMWGSGPLNIKS